MARVLVLASEVVPLPGLPTNGGGLRGWTLARGLECAGFDVTLLFPRHALDDLGADTAPEAREAALPHTFVWDEVAGAVARQAPDVVVCCSWLLAAQLGPCPVPLAVDLAGPVLLEFLYQAPEKGIALGPRKPIGLGHADFVTCAGERQRAYFYPWLLLAGFDQDALAGRVATVPISTAPPGSSRAGGGRAPRGGGAGDGPRIIFAGTVVPWQDPVGPLTAVLDTLERRGRGRLDVYAVEHPIHSQGAVWYARLRERARDHPRLTLHQKGPLPYDELPARYAEADLAFDLFARNPERELAFNTRTVDYLAAGLPVLCADYAELGDLVARYDAGFVVDPADPAAVAAAVECAIDDPPGLAARRANARRLAAERLRWDRTVEPLARWCAAPARRPPGPLDLTALTGTLARDLAAAQRRIAELGALAEERREYALRVERAWADLDAALATRRRAPWRSAARQTLSAVRARLRRSPSGV